MKKKSFKKPHVNKKISLFITHHFLALSKQRYEQKPLSFRSALHFCSAPKSLQIFSRVSFPASKITPITLIKKKDFSNTPLRVVKKDSAPIQFKFFEL